MMQNKNKKRVKKTKLFHITFREGLYSALTQGFLMGKSLFMVDLANRQSVSPLSLTEDVGLKNATDYFKNRDVMIRFSDEIFNQDSVKKINYNASELFRTNIGQSSIMYIIGSEGQDMVLEAFNKIMEGVPENKALAPIQNKLDELRHEKEWIALTKVTFDFVDFIQFYIRPNTNKEKEINAIKQLIAILPSHIKYAVIDTDDKIIASTKKGGWI